MTQHVADIGRRFSHMRRDRHLTQAQAAKLLECSAKTLHSFEHGKLQTDSDTVLRAIHLMDEWENEQPSTAHEKSVTNYATRDTMPPVIDPRDYSDPLEKTMAGLHNLILFVSAPTGDPISKLKVVRTSLQYILDHVLPPADSRR